MANMIMETLLYSVVLLGAYRYGAGLGAAIGTVLGVIETIRMKNLGALGIMSIMGVLAGFFSPLGKLGASLGYLTGAFTVGTLYAPEILAKMIPNLFLSVATFFLIPKKFCKASAFKKDHKKMYIEDRSLSAQKIKEMALSLEQLSKAFKNNQEKDLKISKEEAMTAFQSTATVVCKDCKDCNLCRTSSQGDNYYLYYLLQAFEEQGLLTNEDMPKLFAQICQKQETYMDQLNYSLGKVKNNLTWKNRFMESREVMATQFLELSNIMGDFSERMGSVSDISAQVEKVVTKGLRRERLHLEKLLVLEHENKKKEVYLLASTAGGNCITAKELADSIGNSLECKFKSARDSKNVISKEPGMVHLIEDTNYMVIHGMAKAVKNHEKISGDNFAYNRLSNGKVLLALSDGMGSGEAACKESERVMELTEQLLETGFSLEAAAKMIHSVLLLENNEQQPTTLDIVCIDLYSGVLEGMKFGAAATFIIHQKGKDRVNLIENENLPMGMIKELETLTIMKKIAEGDMLVMVTDGVLEALPGENKEMEMKAFLECMNTDNPGDVADAVLNYACEQDGEPKDDMLVLAVGVWEKH